ncbi:MAG: hypothetical protein EU541_04440 [Promethearchaeota archaeon]|nr:MAG: hypothetical protein EU541_04440 [Candidatus Lokiarchaeota archaeon]
MTDNENETERGNEEDSSGLADKIKSKLSGSSKPRKRTQREVLQEALGLEPETIQTVEEKLFIARFIDYFSEELFDFMYRDKTLNNYKEQIREKVESFADASEASEEEKLLKQSFENKQIPEIIDQLQTKTEELANEKGWSTSVDKKIRNLSLITTIPVLAFLVINTILQFTGLPYLDFTFLLPVLCVFCFVPTLIKNYYAKKWYSFKDENKLALFERYRSDIMILKNFAGDVLKNVRSDLIQYKVPLELIKFILSSRDYETVDVIKKKSQKNVTQYLVNFKYPPDVGPFPIPESLTQMAEIPSEEVERNFVLLENINIQDGEIKEFIPTLKEKKAAKINTMLNNSEFSELKEDIESILPNYSPEMAIFCKCGEMVELKNYRKATWKDQFGFYLFEGKTCECGEKMYAISLMDANQEVPKELRDIF